MGQAKRRKQLDPTWGKKPKITWQDSETTLLFIMLAIRIEKIGKENFQKDILYLKENHLDYGAIDNDGFFNQASSFLKENSGSSLINFFRSFDFYEEPPETFYQLAASTFIN